MLPDKWDWKAFSPIEKATYLAMLSAPLSLLIASILSFMTWREAHEASRLQQRMFAAQNAPIIELVSVHLGDWDGVLKVQADVQNAGTSLASELCVARHYQANGERRYFCDPDGRVASLYPGRETTFFLELDEQTLARLGATPRSVKFPGEEGGAHCVSFDFSLSYTDAVDTPLGRDFMVMLCEEPRVERRATTRN